MGEYLAHLFILHKFIKELAIKILKSILTSIFVIMYNNDKYTCHEKLERGYDYAVNK